MAADPALLESESDMEWLTDSVKAEFVRLVEFAVAAGLGGTLGLDRERAGKPAGFRTHMLVAGASALLVGLGAVLVRRFDITLAHASIETDPTRIVQAIVIGIGFLGAGTIIQRPRSQDVEGLTTAASVLVAAAIGIAVAVHQWIVACGATAITWIVLAIVRHLDVTEDD